MALAFPRILLAYDDSVASQVALEYACSLTRAGATLSIAHALDESRVVATAMTSAAFGAVDPTPFIAAVDDQGAALLKTAVATCALHGVFAEQVIIRDAPEAGIVALGRANRFDLIILGTHGRRGISRALLGSVAEAILRETEVPVLVVTGHAKAPINDRPFERALVALDASDPSRSAMSVAARLSADFGAHLTLCNVIDSRDVLAKAAAYGYDASPFQAVMRVDARKLLQAAAAVPNITLKIDDIVVAEGEPAEAIEHTALQRNCDLIIIGTHGRRGVRRVFLGSVAEAVIRESAIPVLAVPAKRSAH
jgi:nucleotide-binding universal stress UspA family protein